jgi:hypothetical protein
VLRQRRNLGCENVLRICSAYACAAGYENQCLPSLGAAGPRSKESLSRTEGDSGSNDTAPSPSVFSRTEKHHWTILPPDDRLEPRQGSARTRRRPNDTTASSYLTCCLFHSLNAISFLSSNRRFLPALTSSKDSFFSKSVSFSPKNMPIAPATFQRAYASTLFFVTP